MRHLQPLLIYATLALGAVTIWAVGRDHQVEADLARYRIVAARPQFDDEGQLLAARPAANAAPATRPKATRRGPDATRRTGPDDARHVAP
jgi:hypothetical protein